MSVTKTVRAVPVRDFTDAGTTRNFTAGEAVDLTEGEFANFEAAGLVTVEVAVSPAPDAGESATSATSRRR